MRRERLRLHSRRVVRFRRIRLLKRPAFRLHGLSRTSRLFRCLLRLLFRRSLHAEKHFAVPDHIELTTRPFLDSGRAFLKRPDFGDQRLVLSLLVLDILLRLDELMLELPDVKPPALAEPERFLNQDRESPDGDGEPDAPLTHAAIASENAFRFRSRKPCGPDTRRLHRGALRYGGAGYISPCGQSATSNRS